MHVHTSWSFDGHWSLQAVAAALRRRGYDAMLTAEHCQSLDGESWTRYRAECARLSTPGFLVLPGIEYRDADNVVHIPTWGDLPHLGDRLPIGDLVTRVSSAGGVAIMAHPGRRGAWQRFDDAWVEHLSGVEVWNRKYDGWRPGPHGVRLGLDAGLPAYASLDFHRRRQLVAPGDRHLRRRRTGWRLGAARLRGHPRGTSARDAARQAVGPLPFRPRRLLLAAADGGRRSTLEVVRRAAVRLPRTKS